MSATRRIDSPQPPESAEVALFARAIAAISQACGLIELDDLLAHLARSWRELTRSQRSIVGVQEASPPGSRVAIANSDGTSTLTNAPDIRGTDLFDQIMSHTSGSDLDVQGESTRIGLHTEQMPRPFGGIILWGATLLPDDLHAQLCHASAALLGRAVANDRLLREAKLQSLGEFAAGAGHEINNPLAAISGRAQLLLREETDPQRRRHLLTIGAQALRIRDMISDTMLFARPPQPEPSLLNLTDVVDRVTSKFTDELKSRHLTLGGERASDATVWADETQLCVVVSELLRNAIHASPEGGRIELSTDCETASDGRQFARMTVCDEGPGLTDESRDHLFDPFYSGRQAGRGLGFGLSKCWRIITNHGGQIHLDPSDEPGLTIVVHLPVNQE